MLCLFNFVMQSSLAVGPHLPQFTFMHFLHFWDGASKLSILQQHTVGQTQTHINTSTQLSPHMHTSIFLTCQRVHSYNVQNKHCCSALKWISILWWIMIQRFKYVLCLVCVLKALCLTYFHFHKVVQDWFWNDSMEMQQVILQKHSSKSKPLFTYSLYRGHSGISVRYWISFIRGFRIWSLVTSSCNCFCSQTEILVTFLSWKSTEIMKNKAPTCWLQVHVRMHVLSWTINDHLITGDKRTCPMGTLT